MHVNVKPAEIIIFKNIRLKQKLLVQQFFVFLRFAVMNDENCIKYLKHYLHILLRKSN